MVIIILLLVLDPILRMDFYKAYTTYTHVVDAFDVSKTLCNFKGGGKEQPEQDEVFWYASVSSQAYSMAFRDSNKCCPERSTT